MTFFNPNNPTGAPDLAEPALDTSGLISNQGSYFGLPIPVSGGKRALLGVPIFASPVRIEGERRFIDIAYSFGEPMAPAGELLDTKVTKLWINGELVEDAYLNAEGWNTSSLLNYTVYPGYSDQLPDPAIREWLGEDGTPAFRGLIYVVFKDFPLHLFDSQGAVPLVRAELVDVVTNSVQVQTFQSGDDHDRRTALPNWERMHLYVFSTSGGENDIAVIDLTTNVEIARNQILTSDGSPVTFILQLAQTALLDVDTSLVLLHQGTGNSRPLITIDPYSGLVVSEFGESDSGTTSTETRIADTQLFASVSRSQQMNDRLFAAATFLFGNVDFWRLSSSGQVSLAWGDGSNLELFGNENTYGEVADLIAGDPIGAVSGTNRGFGTVLLAREAGGSTESGSAIYRITISEGSQGDGTPDDVSVDRPLRRGFAAEADFMNELLRFGTDFNAHVKYIGSVPGSIQNFWGPRRGVSEKFIREYVDVNDIMTSTAGTFTPTSNPLPNDQPVYSDSVDIDLDDVGDLTSEVLNDRVVFYLDYGSQREISTLSGRIDGPAALEGAVWVHSNNGTSWTEITATATAGVGGEVAYGDLNSGVPVDPVLQLETLRQDVFGSGNPITARYIGIALQQDNYTGLGTLSFLDKPTSYGFDGRLVGVNSDVLYPDLQEPLMVKLWDLPSGLEAAQMWRDNATDDIIVVMFATADPNTEKWMARLRMNEGVRGVPVLDDPEGDGVSLVWMKRLDTQLNSSFATNQQFTHGSLRHSNIDSGMLGVADEVSEMFGLINLANGHQLFTDFTDWRFFGDDMDQVSKIVFDAGQVWYGPGGFLLVQQENLPMSEPDQWVKTLPFLAAVTGYPLSTFLTWFSQRVGYDANDIEITGITDQVIGSIVLQRFPFRELIDNLGIVFDFRAFESEGKIKFVKTKRGSSFVVDYALTTADLSAIEGGEGIEPNDPVAEVQRGSSFDQPGLMELVYLNPETDYQVDVATARRTRFPVSTSLEDDSDPVKFAIPFIMTSADAALRVSRMLYTIWSAQARLEFRLPTEFLEAEPADVISIPVDGITYTVQATETVINADHSNSIQAEAISAEEIENVGSSNPLELPQGVTGPSASELFLLDLPPLSGNDVTALQGRGIAIYSAVVSRGQGSWQAGRLMFRLETPNIVEAYQNGTNSRASGFALTSVGPWPEHSLDDQSTLRVYLHNDDDTLISITDQELLNGDNLAAYGAPGRWEIIQIKTVTNVVGSVYDLTNIVRGLRGTSIFTNQHDLRDQFILLDQPPVRLDSIAPLQFLGRLGEFKAVGVRQDEVAVASQPLLLSGAFERMLPPTSVRATRTGNDIVIEWDRRTRLDGDTVLEDDTETVPQEATSGKFELEIFATLNAVSPIRTVTSLGDAEYTYLEAESTSDYGAVPDVLFLRVYHLSTEAGRSLADTIEIEVEQ